MRHGFSLVELSIVLVILGLLTGGILGGQALIRAAELRAVNTEFQRYMTATQTFRDKYFGLPGDITNAHRFWGALDGNDGTGADCRGESTGTATCNGDGNGQICPDNACASNTYESWLYWKHLANAGLIEGNYGGNPATVAGNTMCVSGSTTQNLPGCNVPGSKLSSGKWGSFYIGQAITYGTFFDGQYGNVLRLDGQGAGGGGGSILKPEELWNIDTKMDDGKPGTGNVVAVRWNTCATGVTAQTDGAAATYALNNTSMNCYAVFRNAF